MNISLRISEASRKFPNKKSVVHQDASYSFTEFETRSNQIANRLVKLGIRPGMRTLLFVKPCLDFSVITFALFKIGAIPVLIDPGMGITNLLRSVAQVKPQALVGIGKVHWLRRLKRSSFTSVKINVSLDSVGGRTHYLYHDLSTENQQFSPLAVTPDDQACILFTSGGTGIPKGVIYTHGILNAQTELLQEMFKLDETQTDLPGFPLFALFTLAMGMTSVIPDMDPTHPASCDPKKIVRNILEHQVTFVAGSPAIWERVGKYCLAHNIQLGSVRQVVTFGAPVSLNLHRMFKKILPFGDTYTPYGATEALPVSLISGSEILQQHAQRMLQGAGTCLGQAVPGTKIKIIKTTDIPEDDLHELPLHSIGEIVVQGPQVTPAYFEMSEETKKAKIMTDGGLWHRMGDVGYLDENMNLWFMGRKAHRVVVDQTTTYYSIPVEAIFNQHPEVKRTALVRLLQVDKVIPGLVIERHDGQTRMDPRFMNELWELGQKNSVSKVIHHFYLHSSFPVDVRHNIKIDRTKLSNWAQGKGRPYVKEAGAESN